MNLTKDQKEKVKAYILQRFNLVELIEGYGHDLIKDTDNRMKMKCPFHNEKTASFMVYLDTNRFHCFGCAESGNAITFMMNQDGKTYSEIIEKFAENIDIQSNKFFADTLINNVNKESFDIKMYSKDTEYELSVFLRDLAKKSPDKLSLVDGCFRDMGMFFSNPNR